LPALKIYVSVDLDNYREYVSLVDARLESDPPSFYDHAIPRFLDYFDRHGIRATFFAIGRDLAVASNRQVLRQVVDRGHEVSNHSNTHPYNFRQLTRKQKEIEIDESAAAIEDATGCRPPGFRVPSCDVDSETLELLIERGYRYDSSVFPTPVMWAFMLYGKLFVRHEEYQLGALRAAFAPKHPYVPSSDDIFSADRASVDPPIVELPVSCSPVLRIPFYSTLLRRLGTRAFSHLVRSYARRGVEIGFLLHAIELAELSGSALGDAYDRMPALALPLRERERFLEHAAATLAEAGEFVTMGDFAETWRAEQQAAA